MEVHIKYEIPLRILKKLFESQILRMLESLNFSSKDFIVMPLDDYEILMISKIGVDVVIRRFSLLQLDEFFEEIVERLKMAISPDYPVNFVSVYVIKDGNIDTFSLSTRDLKLLEDFTRSETKEIDKIPEDAVEKVKFAVNYGEAVLYKSPSQGIFAKVTNCDVGGCFERLLKLGIKEIRKIDNLRRITVQDIINILKAFST